MELKVLRPTGETSRTTKSAGSLALQKDWVSLRLLEQQAEVRLVMGRDMEGGRVGNGRWKPLCFLFGTVDYCLELSLVEKSRGPKL